MAVNTSKPTNPLETLTKGGKTYNYHDAHTMQAVKDLETEVDAIPTELDSQYETPTSTQGISSPVSNDTFQQAIQKLNNAIVDNEETFAAALTEFEGDLPIRLSLPSNYAPSTLTNSALEPQPLELMRVSISKLHKAILDMEVTWAAALNELNEDLTALAARVTALES